MSRRHDPVCLVSYPPRFTSVDCIFVFFTNVLLPPRWTKTFVYRKSFPHPFKYVIVCITGSIYSATIKGMQHLNTNVHVIAYGSTVYHQRFAF